MTALLFLLFCISSSSLAISIHSCFKFNKMSDSLKISVVDISDTSISFWFSSELNMSMMSFLKYSTFMSLLETSEILYFEEKNMIDFLERYKNFCDDYELNQNNQFCKLLRYCNKIIDDNIKIMSKYIDFNWQELKKAMKKKYKKRNMNQQLNFQIFLKIFKKKFCIIKNDLKLYCQQYKSILHSLIKCEQLNEYIRCSWFIKNLSSTLSKKVIWKCALDSENSDIMNFKKISDAVVVYCNAVKALQKFSIMIKNFKDLSKLMNEYQIKWSTVIDRVFESLIVAQTYDMIINEMINRFEAMILSLQTIMKKIDSLMQNMIAFISIFNVYIS